MPLGGYLEASPNYYFYKIAMWLIATFLYILTALRIILFMSFIALVYLIASIMPKCKLAQIAGIGDFTLAKGVLFLYARHK